MTQHTSKVEKIETPNIILTGGKVFFVPPEKRFIFEKFKPGDAVKLLEVKGTVSACFPLEGDAPVNDPPKKSVTYNENAPAKEETASRAKAAGFTTGAEIKKEQSAQTPKPEPAKAPPAAKPAPIAQTPAPEPKVAQKPANAAPNAPTTEAPKGGIAGIVAATKAIAEGVAPPAEPEDTDVTYPSDKELLALVYSYETYWKSKTIMDLMARNDIRAQVSWKNWGECVALAIQSSPKNKKELFAIATEIHAFIEGKVYSDDEDDESSEE